MTSLKFCSSIYGATGVTLVKILVLDYMERLGRSHSNTVLVCMERMGVTLPFSLSSSGSPNPLF